MMMVMMMGLILCVSPPISLYSSTTIQDIPIVIMDHLENEVTCTRSNITSDDL